MGTGEDLVKAPAKPSIRQVLERVVDEMVEKGILWPDAQAEFEKLFIIRVIRECSGSLSRAAERMGVHRNTLTKKLKEYAIDKRDCRG
jgi:DNA-binding NtrC family response regulator